MVDYLRRNVFYLLVILSGLLLALAFCNFGLEWLVWVALIPLLIVVEKENNIKRLMLEAALGGLVFFSITLYWIYYVTIAGLILLTGYLLLYFILFAFLVRLLSKAGIVKTFNQLFIIPSCWVILEYLRSFLFTGFGWASLGYSQYQNLNLIQIASFTGVYGVSFLIVLVNTALKELILQIRKILFFDKRYLKKASTLILITLVCLLAVFIYGDIKLSQSQKEGKTLTISVIQGNILQHQKWEPFYRDLILEKHIRLTQMASFDEPDIIIWPETSLPGYLEEKDLFETISQLAEDTNRPLLIGTATRDKRKEKYYNSAALISREGTIEKVYNKIHLVPFGEYVPLPYIFDFARNLIEMADFSKGKEYTLFEVEGAKFGALICFEDIFPNLTRDFINHGAHFMINITNDAWFMRSPEPYQHLQASVFRAVENRVNVVRAANTGISCFISPSGEVTGRVSSNSQDIFVEGYKTQTIIIEEGRTFYTKFGDIFVIICLGLIIIQAFLKFLRRQEPETN
jgi:apolipoprotein N-acyltransferase